MQTSMHYHAIFCLSRAAGLNVETAKRIAFGSEFVDHLEHPNKVSITFKDGDKLSYFPTLLPSIEDPFCYTQSRCWNSWVPFHFLPACDIGSKTPLVSDKTQQRRASICQQDSPISVAMISAAIARSAAYFNHSNASLADIGLGVALHVFADTYSHHGFSGLQSHFNDCKVVAKDPLIVKLLIIEHISSKSKISFSHMLDDIETDISDEVKKLCLDEGLSEDAISDTLTRMSCGHAQALTLPDIPYLNFDVFWTHFINRGTKAKTQRDNQQAFITACMDIYDYLRLYNGKTQKTEANVTEDELRKIVTHIIETEVNATKREELWVTAYEAGHFSKNTEPDILQQEFPDFEQDMKQFTQELGDAGSMTKTQFEQTRSGMFIQATEEHRKYVLEKLIPEEFRFYDYWTNEKSFTDEIVLTPKNKKEFAKELENIESKTHVPHY